MARQRRKYHFHSPVLVYVVVALFLAIGAVNSQNNLLFVSFGIALGGLIVSGLVSGPAMSDVVIRRATLEPATVGELWHVRYEITNRSRLFPAFAVVVCERPQGATWPKCMPTPTAAVGHIGPRETVTIDAQVRPFLRGEPTFDRIMAWTTFPFGLLKKSVTFEQHDSAVVRPPVLRVRSDVLRRVGAQGRTVTSAPRRLGGGEEFFGLREYAPGDSPRSIAWRASARAGDLVVRQRAAPSPTRIWILLDLRDESGVEDAIVMAASFAAAAADRGYAVGLVSPDAGLLHLPIEGRRQREFILDDLASIDRTDLAEELATPAGRLDAVVVVHAGEVDHALGAPHAPRWSSSRPFDLLEPGQVLPEPPAKAPKVPLHMRLLPRSVA